MTVSLLSDTQPSTAGHPTPVMSRVRVLARGATMACGVCGRRGLFTRWITMTEECPRCGLRFERFPGDFVGAVGINYILSFGILISGLVTFFVLTYPNIPFGPWFFVVVVAIAPVPIITFPISKTLWLAINLLMNPLRENEILPPREWRD